MTVNIYVLVDPRTLKVRYIGRTRCTLKKRLGEHVCVDRNKRITRVKSWIKSLKAINSKPYIRLLTTCEGWEESHLLEQELIERHKEKHDLLNHRDRGMGNPFPLNSDFTRLQISSTLKEGYASGRIKPTRTKPIYVYTTDGSFVSQYSSIRNCARNLSINSSSINKVLTGLNRQMSGYIFKYEYTESVESLKYPDKGRKNILTVYYTNTSVEFSSFRACAKHYNIEVEEKATSSEQLCKEIFFSDKDIEYIQSDSLGRVERNVGTRKAIRIQHENNVLDFSSFKEVCKFYNWDTRKYGYESKFSSKFYKHFPELTLIISPHKIS